MITSNAWTGLSRGTWTWSDWRPATFAKWHNHRPTGDINKTCATLHKGHWEVWNCDDKLFFVCNGELEISDLLYCFHVDLNQYFRDTSYAFSP